jgi:hypothetical protein
LYNKEKKNENDMAAPKRNLFALGNNGGRPPKYKTPEELFERCVKYFESSIELGEKITITGLALFLGFASRNTLYEYEKKEEFKYIIKNAMLVVENSYERNGTNFDIFALKNMGWSDKQEIDHTTKGNEVGNIPITQWISKGTKGNEKEFEEAFNELDKEIDNE